MVLHPESDTSKKQNKKNPREVPEIPTSQTTDSQF